jgi:hypothetical protein
VEYSHPRRHQKSSCVFIPPIVPSSPPILCCRIDNKKTAHVALLSTFTHLSIYSHALYLLRRPYYSSSRSTPTPSHANLYSSLATTKSFFETLLSLPTALIPDFSTIQLAQLVQAIAVLSRLTFLMAKTLNWDSSTTQKEIPFVMVRTPLFSYPFDMIFNEVASPHLRLYILIQVQNLTRG